MQFPALRWLGALLLGLALTTTTAAQNYRPFDLGRTYHYAQASGATTLVHLLQVDSAVVTGADSIFYFNATESTGALSSDVSLTLFGTAFYWQAATGEARVVGYQGTDTVRLLTRAAVGRQWSFSRTVQATVLRRQAQLVLGEPDTVVTIGLSDGQQLQVGRRYGLVSGPALYYYLGTEYRGGRALMDVQLYSVPEIGLGGTDLRASSLYTMHAGDTLYFRSQEASAIANPTQSCRWTAERMAIRSVQVNASGTSVHVTVEVRIIGGPCLGPADSDTTLQSTWDRTLTELMLTGYSTGGGVGARTVAPAEIHPDSLNGLPRLEVSYNPGHYWTTSTYVPGLGQVAYSSTGTSNYPTLNRRLVGFIRSGSRWGDTGLPSPLGMPEASRQLPISLGPNPVGGRDAAVLGCLLDRSQTINLVLYDAVGRVVWQQTVSGAAGEQRLPVAAGAALVPGLYRLRLTLADGRQRMLPLVRE